jgi:hypothetical protein
MDHHTSEKLVVSSQGEDFYGITQPPKTISFIEAFSAK